MADIMGREGYLYLAAAAGVSATSAIECIDTWSITPTLDAIDVTALGSAGNTVARSFDIGLKGATGNASGTMDGADVHASHLISIMCNSAATTVECKFYMDSSHYLSFTALITSASLGGNVADKTTFGFDLTVTGALTYA